MILGQPTTLRRERVLIWITLALCAALTALLLARGLLREAPGASAYAALADAFLHGRLWVDTCPEIDCALWQGKTYIIFPPLPAALLTPIVAVTGVAGFKYAVFLSMVMAGVALWLWKRIFAALDTPPASAWWLLAALAFASPLYYDVMKGNGVWFFAQTTGFLMATLAIAAVVLWRSLALAGLFVALGFLCRQMIVFYPLFLAALALRPDEKLFWPSRSWWRGATIAGLLVLAAVALIFVYNHARFGSIFDTGYAHISNPGSSTVITRRIDDIGLFSPKYVLFNLYYLLLQGFHAEFGGPHLTQLTGVDMAGTALLIASPWIALAFYMKLDRVAAFGLLVIAIIAGVTLFYHSNGFAQVNTQRYALDWLPIAVVLLARTARPQAYAALPLLVTLAILANAAALATSMIVGKA